MAKPLNEEMIQILAEMQEDIIILKSNLDSTKTELYKIYDEIKANIFTAPNQKVIKWEEDRKVRIQTEKSLKIAEEAMLKKEKELLENKRLKEAGLPVKSVAPVAEKAESSEENDQKVKIEKELGELSSSVDSEVLEWGIFGLFGPEFRGNFRNFSKIFRQKTQNPSLPHPHSAPQPSNNSKPKNPTSKISSQSSKPPKPSSIPHKRC